MTVDATSTGEAPQTPPPETWDGSSLWARTLPHRTPPPPLRVDRTADVVVVGAGITGLLTATLLARAGADVLVVDRHGVGGVATRNTTAKVTALQGTVCSSIVEHRGAEVAAQYTAANLHALAGTRELVADLAIDCHLTDAPAYTYATEPSSLGRAERELAAASDAGLAVTWVEQTELPVPVLGAVRLDGQAHIDPGLLCAALAERLGPDALGTAAVRDADESERRCTVALDGGVTIHAEHVVIATQSPVVDPALLANRCKPQQSYCLAARLPGEVPAGMYLSCDSSTRSLRPARLDGETVAVVGGAGHPMGGGSADASRWDELAAWVSDAFGGCEVTHRWATHDLTATDHVPFIGRLAPGAQRRWVATAFQKWGMTNAYVAAHLISEGIAGRTVAWAEAFDSTRLASTLTKDLLSAGATAAKHLTVGRIARRGAPRCTHQGCVLAPDHALGTWDCPCHGSRFTADGQVVQGPARAPLQGVGGSSKAGGGG